MRTRRPFQNILRWIAIAGYLAAIACAIVAFIAPLESNDPVFSSLLASVVFFACVGAVIQVIGSVDLPSLKITPTAMHHATDPIDAYVDTVCKLGCTRVGEVMNTLDRGGTVPELGDLPGQDRRALLDRLRSITAVYDTREEPSSGKPR